MSTIKRIASGSAAGWVRICVSLATQIALVPIFLSNWDPELYGLWLAAQAIFGLLTLIESGHQTYLGFEFVRLGATERRKIQRVISSAIPFALILSFSNLALTISIVAQGWDLYIFGGDARDSGVGLVLLLQSASWVLTGSVGGLLVRIMSPFGYYARFAWWGVCSGIITSVGPAIAVWYGANLTQAGMTLAISTIIVSVPVYFDMFRLMRRESLYLVKPDYRFGFQNLCRSLSLALKALFEATRQQGTRIVLSPLAGAGEMAAFVTMRTGANVALQGLNTITNPLMPELMRFLHQRDQERTEASFGLIWLTVVAIMVPSIIMLQLLAPDLFPLWTRGKFEFDPALFALLSLGVLIFALAQPAIAVAQGNNLLRPQLLISAVSGLVAVGGMFLLVPHWGIRGAGCALLLAELIGLVGFTTVAKRWLTANGIQWPFRPFFYAALATFMASLTLGGIVYLPDSKLLLISGVSICYAVIAHSYWKALPVVARNLAVNAIRKILMKLESI